MTNRPQIYLDYQATTPLDPRVRAAMDAFLDGGGGNPHSSTHRYGWQAAQALDAARREVAALIGAGPEEILFTSGATEANNLAILGHAAAVPGKRHIVTSAIEHPCVLGACRHLESQGYDLTLLPVDSEGLVGPGALEAALRPETALVSVMLANNEIGTVQPVAELAALCRARGITFHTDAAQAAGKIPVDVGALGVSLLSLSAHKMHGPMGVGALYLRTGTALAPRSFGGGQERGLRPGTVPVWLAVGLGAAARIARQELPAEAPATEALRDRLLAGLRARIPDLAVNGALGPRLPGNLNLRCPGVHGEDWLIAAEAVAASTGSACGSGSQEPSHVLQALGLGPEEVNASVRLGLGRFTTEADIDRAVEALGDGLAALRTGHSDEDLKRA
ncbi:MAG: cysteine desulfurase family protein [Kiloniellales bacterium]|nr:cysteine desulfurase family protein [Kiloniellales bacterium]